MKYFTGTIDILTVGTIAMKFIGQHKTSKLPPCENPYVKDGTVEVTDLVWIGLLVNHFELFIQKDTTTCQIEMVEGGIRMPMAMWAAIPPLATLITQTEQFKEMWKTMSRAPHTDLEDLAFILPTHEIMFEMAQVLKHTEFNDPEYPHIH